jgi:5-methyltetrahydropteroyltriglutamate--homocysteine methyltransferase
MPTYEYECRACGHEFEREQRIHEASQYVPLERLALSPQCGFNSALAGNPLTPAEQEAKLRLVTQVARRVWGP